MSRKQVTLDFSDFTGGINLIDDPLRVKDNQCVDGTINALLTKTGPKRRMGCYGLSVGACSAAALRGMDVYRQFDGTESLLAVFGGTVYSVNVATGALTSLYAIGGTGKATIATFRSKAWICNGADTIKIENTTGYKVGIVPPTGATAVAASGGSLPDGVYSVIIGYYRKVSGVITLYSVGQAAISVTLGTGNNKISISVPDSTDAQVGGAVVWISAPSDGGVYYQYGTVDGSGAYSLTVQDTTNKSLSLIYTVEASSNNRPTAFTHLCFHDNRLWGVDPTDKGKVRYSMKASTDYDLERFPGENTINYPFEVLGIFSLGEHLFINTKDGIIKQPYGDPTVRYEWVDKRLHFWDMRTVAQWGNSVVGLTNDGIWLFDGNSFVTQLSQNVKPTIDKIYTMSTAEHWPIGIIFKRDNRTEYHLSFLDSDTSSKQNNRRLVLDLDSVQVYAGNNVTALWEVWDNGFEGACISAASVFYAAQNWYDSTNYKPLIYREIVGSNPRGTGEEYYIYDDQGRYVENLASDELATTTIDWATVIARRAPNFILVTKKKMLGLNWRLKLSKFRAIANLGGQAATIEIFGGGEEAGEAQGEIGATGSSIARFDFAAFDVDTFAPASTSALVYKQNLSAAIKEYSFYIKITHSVDNPYFKIMSMQLETMAESSRFI